MQAAGDRDFPFPPDELYSKLSDAAFLGGCLKDVELVRADADVAEWKMRPKLAFMAGVIDNTLSITAREVPTAMRASVVTKGIGATATVETQLVFTSHGGGTRVHWELQIAQLTGLLKLVPKALIQGAAMKVVDEVWGMIEAKLQH